LLNGEELGEETELGDGDLITLGDTELRFTTGAGETQEVDEGDFIDADATVADGGPVEATVVGPAPEPEAPAPRPRPESLPVRAEAVQANIRGRPVVRSRARSAEAAQAAREGRRKLLVSTAAAVGAIILLLGGWSAIRYKKQREAQRSDLVRRAHHDDMSEMFKGVKVLVRAGRWKEAREELEEIRATDPDFEPQQIAKYLENAELEIPNQIAMESANNAIDGGRLGDAVEALKAVKPTLQSDSTLKTVREALDARFADRLAEARGLAATRDLATATRAKEIAQDLVEAKPEDRDASELLLRLSSLVNGLGAPVQMGVTVEVPWADAQQRFRGGDPKGALAAVHACAARSPRCREMEGQIDEWTTGVERVEELSESELLALYELDKKLAGGASSEQSRPIRTRLVSKLFVKASTAKTTGNWSRAIEDARKVLQVEPDHLGARALVQDARAQAKEVYLRGYQLKETNPEEAIRLLKDVMNMTPTDDEYHQKAKARLADLEGR
jgi:tetratricopeptide (TPR) repeat protein